MNRGDCEDAVTPAFLPAMAAIGNASDRPHASSSKSLLQASARWMSLTTEVVLLTWVVWMMDACEASGSLGMAESSMRAHSRDLDPRAPL